LEGEAVNARFVALARTRDVQHFDRVLFDKVFELANLLGEGIAAGFAVVNVQDRFSCLPGIAQCQGAAT
jgi:hypothetical protein